MKGELTKNGSIRYKCEKGSRFWLDLRLKNITATEISCLFALNPWASSKKMWARKLQPEAIVNKHTIMGKIAEPAVIEAVSMFCEVDAKPLAQGCDVIYVKEDVRLSATPDAYIQEGDEIALLEIKTTSAKKFDMWDFNEDIKDTGVPIYYLLQVYGQMICTGVKKSYISVMPTLIDGDEFYLMPMKLKVYEIFYDERVVDMIFRAVKKFWADPDNYKVDIKDKELLKSLYPSLFERVY